MARDKEYDYLKKEILNNASITSQVFTVTITAAVFIIGLGAQQESWPIFFSAPLLLLPSLEYIGAQLAAAARIGAYISVFLEDLPINGRQWQHSWQRLRFSEKRSRIREGPENTYSIIWAYRLLIGLSIFLAFIYFIRSHPPQMYSVEMFSLSSWIPISVIAFLTIVATLMISIRASHSISLRFYESCIESWDNLSLASALRRYQVNHKDDDRSTDVGLATFLECPPDKLLILRRCKLPDIALARTSRNYLTEKEADLSARKTREEVVEIALFATANPDKLAELLEELHLQVKIKVTPQQQRRWFRRRSSLTIPRTTNGQQVG